MAGKQLKRKYRIKGLTPKQQEWLQGYEVSTMLEPLGLEEMALRPGSFDYWARFNIERFEEFSSDALHRISACVPYTDPDSGWMKQDEQIIRFVADKLNHEE